MKKGRQTKSQKPPKVFFADIAVDSLEPRKTLPAKFKRMLKRLKLSEKIEDKNVTIKMHLGANIGYTTIHPLFVRILVQAVKDGGAKSVKVMDGNAEDGVARGYTPEVLGCPVVNTFGMGGKYYYKERIGYHDLDYALLSGEALDSDFIIDLSHVKGHGDCGFGGAIKNIAMGMVPQETRFKIHALEGGITYDEEKCTFCKKCFESCPNDAIKLKKDEKKIYIFFHNCTYCQHCVMVCPTGAIKMENRKFEPFSRGMAKVTKAFLEKFNPNNLLFINFLTNITIYCDCWGMSTASLAPDIGILASEDIAAVETASLDMIKTEDLIPKGLPKRRELLDNEGHLFERIFAKDPYLMIKFLEEIYECSSQYRIIEIN